MRIGKTDCSGAAFASGAESSRYLKVLGETQEAPKKVTLPRNARLAEKKRLSHSLVLPLSLSPPVFSLLRFPRLYPKAAGGDIDIALVGP